MEIKYLKYFEIDPVKWDKCINSSFNGIVYAYSWYLSVVCQEWDALVLDNYKAVMPLPRKKKFGIYYSLQPHFTQQLGIFSNMKLDSSLTEAFLKKIPSKFWLIELNLNNFNKLKPVKSFKYNFAPTYKIDLINRYEHNFKLYSKNTKRNIKKAIKHKVSITNAISINDFINFVENNLVQKIKNLTPLDYSNLRTLTSILLRNKIAELYGAFSKRNELCAAALFVTARNQSIYLVGASSQEGFENKAMFLLIDRFIYNNSEYNITLDFEGSRIEGIARFYKGFGAKKTLYPIISKNKVPIVFKLLRKWKNKT